LPCVTRRSGRHVPGDAAHGQLWIAEVGDDVAHLIDVEAGSGKEIDEMAVELLANVHLRRPIAAAEKGESEGGVQQTLL
jgi:hypothetical protein